MLLLPQAGADYARPFNADDFLYILDGDQIVERGLFRAPAPTISDLELDRFRFGNYTEFIDYLLKENPDFKFRNILLHHSASLQFASLEHPRVLLFGGGMVYAFSEHPLNREPRVEILEVSREDYQIKMAEIVFDAEGPKLQREPKACAACHGSPAKMLWDPYDFWPQAFAGAVGSPTKESEIAAYKDLFARRSSSPLLSRLDLPAEFSLGQEGNTAFTQFVGQANLAGWAKRELGSPGFKAWRAPLLSILSVCQTSQAGPQLSIDAKWESLFKPEERAPIEGRLRQIHADAFEARAEFKKFQDDLLEEFLPNSPFFRHKVDHTRLENETADIARIRTVLDLGGVDASNLTTSPFANAYFISNPAHVLLDFKMVLFELFPDWFEGLTKEPLEFGLGKPTHFNLKCDELAARSFAESRPPLQPGPWSPHGAYFARRPVVNRCASCHTEGRDPDAPRIPFHDSLKLSAWLRDPAIQGAAKIRDRVTRTGRGAMPPRHPLTREEIESLNAFVSVLE